MLSSGGSTALPTTFSWNSGAGMKILVVEDEPDLLRVLSQALRESGYAVDEAADGEEGLFKAKAWEYDAVILDLLLPKLNGWDVLQNLRKERKTPVLILTARDSVQDRVKGLDAGADDYLAKPFHLTELLARVRALIRRSAGLAVSEMQVGQLLIDTRSRTVSRAGTEISLTPREYALLELLALNRGSIVTRTQIYEHLFEEQEESFSNLVDVHVSNLRRKLGGDCITTRRGQGYLLHD
jgi:two-component system OmpR family response regulator